MKKIDIKKQLRQIKFITEHSLNEDQRKKLIQSKLERAERVYRSRQVQHERTLQP